MEFIIVSPKQSCGGGPLILYKLCKLLNEQGYKARIYNLISGERSSSFIKRCISYFKECLKHYLKYDSILMKIFFRKKANKWRFESIKGVKTLKLPFYNKKNTIVIYPEIIYGNPLKALNVVRWLLSYDKFKGEKYYSDDDLVFTYRTQFNDFNINPTCRKVTIQDFNKDLYKRYNYGKRSGTCFIIRKGSVRKDLPKHFDGIIVDNLSEEEKVKVFNICEKCFCYDMQTFYATIAAFCGCDVECVVEEGKTRNDYLKKEDVVYGVAYGHTAKELKFAKETRSKILDVIEERERNNIKNVKYLIEECINYFQKIM